MQLNLANQSNDRDLKLVVLILLLGTIVFHLGLAWKGRGLGRDQHLGTAVEYAKHQIDLLRPIILGANANDTPTPLEFPLWQAITALLMKIFGRWYGWGNVTSLVFHISTLCPLFFLGQRMFSTRVAWWAVTLFLAQPLAFMWGGMASVDGMSATFAIWFVFLSWRMMSTARWSWWPATAIAGCLSATTKAPFFMVAGLTTFFWLLYEHRRSRTAWLQLSSTGAISLAAFVWWNHHANTFYEIAELPYCDLRIGQGASIMAWWFGDLATRLNAWNWIRGAWRASTVLFGSLLWLILPIAGWFLRGSLTLRLWIGAGICTLLVFTNLILIHWHYYYMFSAPIALMAALAAVEMEPALWRILPPKLLLRASVYLALIAVSVAQGLQSMHLNLFLDPYPQTCARIINEQTAPTDKLVVWGGGWTVPLLRAERQGVSILNFEPIEAPTKLMRLKQLGYDKLVLMNTSPLLVAINTASGTGGFRIKQLREELPPDARKWKTVFESPSVLILEIPQ